MSKKKNVFSKVIISLLVIIMIIGFGAFMSDQGFSVIGDGDTVWIPDYGTVKCEQTRLECSPGPCNDANPVWKDIKQKGDTHLFCGEPTLADANYYEGCEIHLKSEGLIDLAIIDVCDNSGCDPVKVYQSVDTYEIELQAYEYLKINPTGAKYKYYMKAPVYGISIEGSIKPQYADRCNVAQLLNDKQIATLKDSPDYAKTVNAGEINPGNFPVVFIVGYKESYKDQRVMEINGDTWFVEDIGTRCKVEKDTNDRWVVTDKCVNDNSIECLPNILNCDKNGHLTSSVSSDEKSCVPGTLIGSSTERTAVNADKACRIKCNDKEIPVNYDCVEIPKCADGEVLSQDYECVDSTKLTEKEVCEANDGRFIETVSKDGSVSYSCDYSKADMFPLYLGLGALAVILVMLVIKSKMKRRRK